MSRKLILMVTVALLALTLAACKPITAPTPVPDADSAQTDAGGAAEPAEDAAMGETEVSEDMTEEAGMFTNLSDTAWTVVSYGVETLSTPLEGSYPSVHFMIDRYSGNTGCNYMQGTFTADEEKLLVRPPVTTTRGCADEELFQQEINFLTALTAAETYLIEDDILHLYVGDIEIMTLQPLEPVPFEGTVWKLHFFRSNQVEWMPLIEGTTITALFDGESISGNAGCNDYMGAYTMDDRTVQIGPVAATRKLCVEPEGIMEQEMKYLEDLQSAGLIIKHARALDVRDASNLPFLLFGAE